MDMARSLEIARSLSPDQISTALLKRLHDRSGIHSRGCAVLRADGSVPLFGLERDGAPVLVRASTEDRMNAYRELAAPLAVRAGRAALDAAGTEAGAITHLVSASCTGFDAPGFDQAMIRELGLSPRVRRTHIGFMGCHAAVNALAVASAFAEQDPSARVLVACVELSSLHFHFDARVDRLVANTLFADGAAAAVVSVNAGSHAPALARFAGSIIPGSEDAMAWSIADHGFQMTLGADVPALIASDLAAWVDGELASLSMGRAQVGGWAIHPGGPRVIDAVVQALALPAGADAASRQVLREHGNMSSATLLFILDRLGRSGVPRPWVGLAFGPGLAGEMVVLR